MGKPRRLSSSFFMEERAALHNARVKIRTLQQRKSIEFSNFTDLPKEIPLSLVIGTKVTGMSIKSLIMRQRNGISK